MSYMIIKNIKYGKKAIYVYENSIISILLCRSFIIINKIRSQRGSRSSQLDEIENRFRFKINVKSIITQKDVKHKK